ncbi:MAG: hypothetical protein WC465_04310 [Patescibacteria group bacterium]
MGDQSSDPPAGGRKPGLHQPEAQPSEAFAGFWHDTQANRTASVATLARGLPSRTPGWLNGQ